MLLWQDLSRIKAKMETTLATAVKLGEEMVKEEMVALTMISKCLIKRTTIPTFRWLVLWAAPSKKYLTSSFSNSNNFMVKVNSMRIFRRTMFEKVKQSTQ